MLRSEAENAVRRAMEETGAQFTDEQIAALAAAMVKIAGRIIEEALSTWNRNSPGGKPNFFSG
jgi:hypothetical protein